MNRATASPRTQQERSEATTSELVEAARRLFAADGFQATSLDDIVEAAGVTKGALYHHFKGKGELFAAVFEQEQRRLAEVTAAAYSRRRDPWNGFHDACRAFVEATSEPGVQQIMFFDADAVLGYERVREIQAEYVVAQIKFALEQAIEGDYISRRPVEPLAQMLQGAVCAAAMMVARAEDQGTTRRQVQREIRVLLDGLACTARRA